MLLCKIGTTEIYFLFNFLRLACEFLGIDIERDTNFFTLENQNCFLRAAWMPSGTKIVVDKYNC
jgi:hypothetical protein